MIRNPRYETNTGFLRDKRKMWNGSISWRFNQKPRDMSANKLRKHKSDLLNGSQFAAQISFAGDSRNGIRRGRASYFNRNNRKLRLYLKLGKIKHRMPPGWSNTARNGKLIRKIIASSRIYLPLWSLLQEVLLRIKWPAIGGASRYASQFSRPAVFTIRPQHFAGPRMPKVSREEFPLYCT